MSAIPTPAGAVYALSPHHQPEERLIGHLLMREREAAAVQLILSGKENGFAEETIRELRALYG